MIMVFEVYFIFIIFSLKSILEKKNVIINVSEKAQYFPCILILILIVGFRDKNLVKDYGNYEWFFDTEMHVVEPTFLWITLFVKNVLHGSIKTLMFIYAFLSIYIKWKAIEEYSSYPALSFTVFISDLMLLHECTQIRAGVAVSLFLLSMKSLYNRDLKKYCLWTVIASLFHISSLLMLPIYFINKNKINRKLWIGMLFCGYFLVVFHFNPMLIAAKFIKGYIGNKLIEYTSENNSGNFTANVFSLYTLSKLFILLILIWKVDLVLKSNKYAVIFIKIQCISIFSLCFFSQNLAAALRISEFYTVIDILLFPLIVSTIKEKVAARVLLICLCIGWLSLRIFRYNLIAI